MNKINISTIMVMVFSLVSAFLGFGRETYIAYFYGATEKSDVYYISSVITDMIAGWISYSLTNAVIPILKEELRESDESTKDLTTSIFLFITVCLILLSIVIYWFRSDIIYLISPGINKYQHQLSVKFLIIMLPSITLSGLSGVLWAIHNVYENFSYPSLIGVAFNLLLLIGSFCLQPWLGFESLAYGYLLGVIGRLLIQLIPLIVQRKFGRLTIRVSPIKKLIKFLMPILISVGVTYINQIVDKILASNLDSGQISHLNYATKLGMLPAGIIGISLATTLYTKFVDYNSSKNYNELRRLISKSISYVSFLSLVIGGILLFYRKNIVSLLFYHGAFSIHDVYLTAEPIGLFGVFCLFYILNPIFTHYFYARKDSKFILVSSLIAVFVNIIFSIVLVQKLGINGLVLANGICQLIYVLILGIRMLKLLKCFNLKFMVNLYMPGLLAGASFLTGSYLFILIYRTIKPQSFIDNLVYLINGFIVGSLFLGVFSLFFRKNDISIMFFKIVKMISKVQSYIKKRMTKFQNS